MIIHSLTLPTEVLKHWNSSSLASHLVLLHVHTLLLCYCQLALKCTRVFREFLALWHALFWKSPASCLFANWWNSCWMHENIYGKHLSWMFEFLSQEESHLWADGNKTRFWTWCLRSHVILPMPSLSFASWQTPLCIPCSLNDQPECWQPLHFTTHLRPNTCFSCCHKIIQVHYLGCLIFWSFFIWHHILTSHKPPVFLSIWIMFLVPFKLDWRQCFANKDIHVSQLEVSIISYACMFLYEMGWIHLGRP